MRFFISQQRTWEGLLHSTQRLDLLIVSISGAGIYVCLETIKYLNGKELEINCLIKWSGGLFLLAILSNFISQIAKTNSYSYEYRMCDKKLGDIENSTNENESDIKKFEKLTNKADKYAVRFNFISAALMIACCFVLYYIF